MATLKEKLLSALEAALGDDLDEDETKLGGDVEKIVGDVVTPQQSPAPPAAARASVPSAAASENVNASVASPPAQVTTAEGPKIGDLVTAKNGQPAMVIDKITETEDNDTRGKPSGQIVAVDPPKYKLAYFAYTSPGLETLED